MNITENEDTNPNESYQAVIKQILKEFDDELGRLATFNDFIEKHIRLNGYETTKNDYSDLLDTWKSTGRDYNADDTFCKYFINTETNKIIPQ